MSTQLINTIKLAEYEVDIKQSLTWGDLEAINSFPGVKMKIGSSEMPEVDASVLLERKYQTLELAVVEIRDKDGKKMKYNREWIYNLSKEEGDRVYNMCERATQSKKKEEVLG